MRYHLENNVNLTLRQTQIEGSAKETNKNDKYTYEDILSNWVCLI